MERRLAWFALGVALFFIFPRQVSAAPVSSADLLNYGSRYQGKLIEFEGEVIGDLMKRGEYAWIPVSDGLNTIGVWAPALYVEQIKYVGSYRYRGDRVRVIGIFHQACRQHGGDLDIHAKSLEIIKQGCRISHPLDRARVLGAGILGLFAVILFFVNRFRVRDLS
ncbi:MAG: DNA-binding protein [Firmicutes bacterium]|nr:DNA-binding protein [Bacillota bacterium]